MDIVRSTNSQLDEQDSDFALGCQWVANLEPRYPSSFPSAGFHPVTYCVHATSASTAFVLQGQLMRLKKPLYGIVEARRATGTTLIYLLSELRRHR
jgi:hypothetical protein